ncbi:MAG: 4-hydroxyphenylpyruvate dioxygenase [Deltaproteobacteria bacterium]|nr:4-hydroxyphenylpyruvate dioxygenase [Deltaproteobacteria bacterium]
MKIDPQVHIGRPIDIAATPEISGHAALDIEAVDHIEIYSANARQAAFYYSQILGLTPAAYRGPETGYRDSASYMLTRRDITLVVTGPLQMTSPVAFAVNVHGDTVHSVAFRVKNCVAFYKEAVRRGADSTEVPTKWSDEKGSIIRAKIKTYGDTVHSIVERDSYKGLYWPGFVPYEEIFQCLPEISDMGLLRVDHIVGNVELGRMDEWVGFYEKVLGFSQMQQFTDQDISTEYSALMSKVMRNGSSKIKMPINEPAQGKRKSQIEEYLNFHNGPGVQHIALITNDIITTVREMKRRGMAFLRVPRAYYDDVPGRVGSIKEDLNKLAELGILIDRDDDGYLLQIFTKPVLDRPTLFFEIIQREGSQGFGIGNFKALFEAIEKEQALRGNL